MHHPSPGISRRGLLGVLAGAAVPAARASAREEAPDSPAATTRPFRNPFVYRFTIGALEAFSIADCNLAFREGLSLMHPGEARGEMREEMIRHGERTDLLPLHVNILAVRAGREVALFDAGFGPTGNAKMGWLADGLAAAGISPEDVTAGFLSHAHADHLNGFVRDGKPAFPRAAIHLLPEELTFWRGPSPDFSKSRRDKGPLPGMIRDVREKYDILGDRLQTVPDGATLFHGHVRVEAAPGHTDGHACFRITSETETLLHITDLAHHSILMFRDPEWNIAFDHNPDVAIATRKRYWAEAAAGHLRCYGFHLPWPGLGRIVDRGAGSYAWWPEAPGWGEY